MDFEFDFEREIDFEIEFEMYVLTTNLLTMN
jgi:hypothetical protein